MMDILAIDAVSYATAVGQAAAMRLASAMTDGEVAPECWYNGGFGEPEASAEEAVQKLGDYCCNYHATPVGEQLYRKAGELRLHGLDVNDWAGQPVWMHVAYRVFAAATVAAFSELSVAQSDARQKEDHARQAALAVAPAPVEDTVMEQSGDVDAQVFEEVVETVGEDWADRQDKIEAEAQAEGLREQELAAGAGSPAVNVADVAAGENAGSGAREPAANTKRKH
jgi:hypothetical protein